MSVTHTAKSPQAGLFVQEVEGGFVFCRFAAAQTMRDCGPFSFWTRTEEELSVLCREGCEPSGAQRSESGWRLFRVAGTLEFSLVGILAQISSALAGAGISLCAFATFDTDYCCVKEEKRLEAKASLEQAGIAVQLCSDER